ncbi:SDR family NAD(P)-dependent oxidoreductase [Streptomyces sp. NBC_01298]|uniref:SDR family NAD(P)-dependent oxidoreductase n=1 Tax=Streptomyces sp. NBC_01298 TaxID=2903817 RepID=UPI002E12505D|nr:SDR family NAD(P)-dependent oxidoreductase [Streptomyces sp. NBC_01298]
MQSTLGAETCTAAHYRTCHALTPGMIERRWGRIVNIGSVNARAGRTNLVAYSTSKTGLLGLTPSLARELGPYGIRVNTVLPGAIEAEAETSIPAHHRGPPGRPDQPPVRPATRTPQRRRGPGRVPRGPLCLAHHWAIRPRRAGWLLH